MQESANHARVSTTTSEPRPSGSGIRKLLKVGSSFLFLLLLAPASLPQSGVDVVTPDIRRVGDKLACKCGACNNTVATCQMLQCGYSYPARTKIAELQKQGASDETIVASFVKEGGLAALAVPPTEGFHLLGYLMPFVVILLGIGAIALYWVKFRKPATVPELPVDARYRERIEREMADLD